MRVLRLWERSRGWRAEKAESAEAHRSRGVRGGSRLFAFFLCASASLSLGQPSHRATANACSPRRGRALRENRVHHGKAATGYRCRGMVRLCALCHLCGPSRGTLQRPQSTMVPLWFSQRLCASAPLRLCASAPLRLILRFVFAPSARFRQNGKGPAPHKRPPCYRTNFQRRYSTPAVKPAPALYSWFLR